MNEEEREIIYLTDEEGNEEANEVLGMVEYDGCEYAVLYPQEGEDGMVEIVRVEELNNEEDIYLPIEDDETLNSVFAIFKEQYKDQYDFE